MIIYFIRHGQTDDNVQGIIQGHLDTPLNEHGRKESRLLADRLRTVRFDEALSSSLSRAKETAQIVLANQDDPPPLQTDPGLMERYLGSLQGRRRKRGEPLPNDVESGDKFRSRVTQWFLAFLTAHEGHLLPTGTQPPTASGAIQNGRQGSDETEIRSGEKGEHTVLVLSHGAYLTALLSILLHPPFAFVPDPDVDIRQSCYNTSIMRIRVMRSPTSEQAVASLGAHTSIRDRVHSAAERLAGGKGDHKHHHRMEKRAKAGEAQGGVGWRGNVMSWADVKHLDSLLEDVGDGRLADNVR